MSAQTNPYQTGPFRHVSDMETPLDIVRSLLLGMSFIAETLSDEKASAVQSMAHLALREVNAAEELRGKLFHSLHPSRDKLSKEGA